VQNGGVREFAALAVAVVAATAVSNPMDANATPHKMGKHHMKHHHVMKKGM
jgi:hypothetical protein